MADTPPPLATEQSNSGSDDFEFIEKEDVSKVSYDAIPDLIQTAQQPELDTKDGISTDQDSNLSNLVGLEFGDSLTPATDSLVIIEPEIPTHSIDEILTDDRENIEVTAAKVEENTLDSISKEVTESRDVIKDSEEIFPTDREISKDAISKDHEISQDIPLENREMSNESLLQDHGIPEDAISKGDEISQDIILPENSIISVDPILQDRENPEGTIAQDREISEQPDSKDEETHQDQTFENPKDIPEIDSVLDPKTPDDVIDKDDAEVMDILFSPKETMDSGLADNVASPSYLQQQQQQPLDDDVTETQQQYTDKQTLQDSSDSPDIDNSNSTNYTGEDTTQDGEFLSYHVLKPPCVLKGVVINASCSLMVVISVL